MLKKTLLLASAVMALVAFAVPAAQANQWYTDTGGPGGPAHLLGSTTATSDQITLTGTLTTTAGPGFAFRTGPCPVDMTIRLWNNSGQATGEVNNLLYGAPPPCPTSIPGCEVTEAGSGGGFPWHIDVTGDAIAITGMSFFKTFNDGCTALGIPPGIKLGGSGTATTIFNTTTHCFDFNDSGHLSGGIGPVQIQGELCPEPGNTLTLK